MIQSVLCTDVRFSLRAMCLNHRVQTMVSLPLLGVGAFTLMLSFCFCFYLWRLKRNGAQESQGYRESTFKTKAKTSANETCSVCLEDFTKGDKIAICTCRHVFHSKCLTQWLQCRNNCPLCKAPVTKSARETTGLMQGAASGSSV
ncbi:hypothetical protein RRG08_046778 [Elysia crispata]|uniref:RING-type domain-containing protein n=1 Tax=Elysia crispata TaxID=231223 RepID=A0AAE0ZWC5_9GAST|nr:hypothetical protein RRG08_046778 [Elysia crispata]